MKRTLDMWKGKLQAEMRDEMSRGVSLDSLNTTQKLMDNWLTAWELWGKLDSLGDTIGPEKPMYRLTEEDIQKWNDGMKNADGTTGGHWTVDQTTSVAQSVGVYFEHITPMEFNVAMNMMYSDYYMVLSKYGVDSAAAYGDLAKAFLFDRDGGKPADKLTAYYCWIVKPNHK